MQGQGMMIMAPKKSSGMVLIIILVITVIIIGGGAFYFISTAKKCDTYVCSGDLVLMNNPESSIGDSDDQCCVPRKCSGNSDTNIDVVCPPGEKLIGDPDYVDGSSSNDCCELDGPTSLVIFEEDWTDMSDEEKILFNSNFKTDTASLLNLESSNIIILDGYPISGSTVVQFKVSPPILKSDIEALINDSSVFTLTGVVKSVSISENNQAAKNAEMSLLAPPSSVSAVSAVFENDSCPTGYGGPGCNLCNIGWKVVYDLSQDKNICSQCPPNHTTLDYTDVNGSETTCLYDLPECSDGEYVNRNSLCSSCGGSTSGPVSSTGYFGLTTNSSDRQTHDPTGIPDAETCEPGQTGCTETYCSVLKYGFGGPQEGTNGMQVDSFQGPSSQQGIVDGLLSQSDVNTGVYVAPCVDAVESCLMKTCVDYVPGSAESCTSTAVADSAQLLDDTTNCTLSTTSSCVDTVGDQSTHTCAYVPATSPTCPSGCSLSGTDEACIPSVQDCSTNYVPGSASQPSTTCPSDCDFTAATATCDGVERFSNGGLDGALQIRQCSAGSHLALIPMFDDNLQKARIDDNNFSTNTYYCLPKKICASSIQTPISSSNTTLNDMYDNSTLTDNGNVPGEVGYGYLFDSRDECSNKYLCGENGDEECHWFDVSPTVIEDAAILDNLKTVGGVEVASRKYNDVSYEECSTKNNKILEMQLLKRDEGQGPIIEGWGGPGLTEEYMVGHTAVDINAIMGYEYRPLIKQVERIGGKIAALTFSGVNETDVNVIQSGNMSSSLIDKKWFCDFKNNVLISEADDSCGFGRYGAKSVTSYDGHIGTEQPFYNGCIKCDAYSGRLANVDSVEVDDTGAPIQLCGKCSSSGYCLEPKCRDGFYYNLDRCVRCNEINNADSYYSDLTTTEKERLTCTNSTDTKFGGFDLTIDLPTMSDWVAGEPRRPTQAHTYTKAEIQKIDDVKNLKYDQTSGGQLQGGICTTKENNEFGNDITPGQPPWPADTFTIWSEANGADVAAADYISEEKLTEGVLDCLYKTDKIECETDLTCEWNNAIDIVQKKCSSPTIAIDTTIHDLSFAGDLNTVISNSDTCSAKPAGIINKLYTTIESYVEDNADCNQALFEQLNISNSKADHNANLNYQNLKSSSGEMTATATGTDTLHGSPIYNLDGNKLKTCGFPCAPGFKLNPSGDGDTCIACSNTNTNFETPENTSCSYNGINKNIECKQGFVHIEGNDSFLDADGSWTGRVDDTCMDCLQGPNGISSLTDKNIKPDDADGTKYYSCSEYNADENIIVDLRIEACAGDYENTYRSLIKGNCKRNDEIQIGVDTYNKCGSCSITSHDTREKCIAAAGTWNKAKSNLSASLAPDDYIWTSDSCEACTGTWSTDAGNSKLLFTQSPSVNIACPYVEPEKQNMSTDYPIKRRAGETTNMTYTSTWDRKNPQTKTTTNDWNDGPELNTLYGIQAASSLTNKGYEPGFDIDSASAEYFQRNNSWGSVNNVKLEDPAICERSIAAQYGNAHTTIGRTNMNNAVWPDTWLGKSFAHDLFGGWDSYGTNAVTYLPRHSINGGTGDTQVSTKGRWLKNAAGQEYYILPDEKGPQDEARSYPGSTSSVITRGGELRAPGVRNGVVAVNQVPITGTGQMDDASVWKNMWDIMATTNGGAGTRARDQGHTVGDIGPPYRTRGGRGGVNVSTLPVVSAKTYTIFGTANFAAGNTFISDSVGGGGKVGGDITYAASTHEAKEVEHGIPGACFINRNHNTAVGNSMTYGKTDQQVWTGKALWGNKELENETTTIGFPSRGSTSTLPGHSSEPINPKHNGYQTPGNDKNRYKTGFVVLQDGTPHDPRGAITSHPSQGTAATDCNGTDCQAVYDISSGACQNSTYKQSTLTSGTAGADGASNRWLQDMRNNNCGSSTTGLQPKLPQSDGLDGYDVGDANAVYCSMNNRGRYYNGPLGTWGASYNSGPLTGSNIAGHPMGRSIQLLNYGTGSMGAKRIQFHNTTSTPSDINSYIATTNDAAAGSRTCGSHNNAMWPPSSTPYGNSGPGCTWGRSMSPSNRTNLLTYKESGIHSDPIKKSDGSSTNGRMSKVQDKDLKICSDHCQSEEDCGSFWFYNYRDASTTNRQQTLLYGGEDRSSASAGQHAGRCCRKKHNPAYEIKVPIDDKYIKDIGTSTGNTYFPYETFIQCPRDPIYAALEDKIYGTSVIAGTPSNKKIRTNTYDDLVHKEAGTLIQSKTAIGQSLGIDSDRADPILRQLQDTFHERQLFTKSDKILKLGAQKEAKGCIMQATALNKEAKKSVISYTEKVRDRKWTDLKHYGKTGDADHDWDGIALATPANNEVAYGTGSGATGAGHTTISSTAAATYPALYTATTMADDFDICTYDSTRTDLMSCGYSQITDLMGTTSR